MITEFRSILYNINETINRMTSGKKNHRKTRKGFRKMNCSPMVENKTISQNSCFTNKTLEHIKKSYNKHHRESPITTTNPKETWNILKEKLSSCDKEDCWLKEITDTKIREKIDKYIFAPDHPAEWKRDYTEWLSNFDIFDVLHQYEETYKFFKFIGPTPIDFDSRPSDMKGDCVWKDLCNLSLSEQQSNGINKIGIVFNLDKHDKDGSHWISLFIDLKDSFIFFLDSAGEKPPPEVSKLVKRIKKQGKELSLPIQFKYYENHPLEHQMRNTECGMYSIYFIITMVTDKTEFTRFSNYQDKINFFKKKRIPDKYVNQFRKIYFNVPDDDV